MNDAHSAHYVDHAEECEVPFCEVCWGAILDRYCSPDCLEVNGGPCDTDGGGPCQ